MATVSNLDSSTTTAPDLVRFSPLIYFDKWFIQKTLSPHIRKFCDWNIHPNVVTGISLVMAAAIPFFHHNRLPWGVVASIVGRQLLDCLDGEIARGCGKTTSLGALLDSISDGVFYLALISLLVSIFTQNPLLILVFSCLSFSGLFVIHVSICKGSALIDHSVKTYATPSLYRKSYAFLVNSSLIFVIVFAIVYRLLVK
jgi:phosphatidylglycerophosphate synthase